MHFAFSQGHKRWNARRLQNALVHVGPNSGSRNVRQYSQRDGHQQLQTELQHIRLRNVQPLP